MVVVPESAPSEPEVVVCEEPSLVLVLAVVVCAAPPVVLVDRGGAPPDEVVGELVPEPVEPI